MNSNIKISSSKINFLKKELDPLCNIIFGKLMHDEEFQKIIDQHPTKNMLM